MPPMKPGEPGNNSASAPALARAPVRVLFVCLGNICRSPMAHAVFEDLVAGNSDEEEEAADKNGIDGSTAAATTAGPISFTVDSAGTGAYHEGSAPDRRTLTTLERHGIRGFQHAARKVRTADFTQFDYVLAMDAENLEDLELVRARATRAAGAGGAGGQLAKLALFGEYGGRKGEDIVDPYYGGGEGFEAAYKQCVRFSKGLFAEILEERKTTAGGGGSGGSQ